jgi:glycosyltransferase involved in cell wall biosynthesis
MPQEPLRLTIYGVAQDESGREYERYLRLLAASDKRIEFRQPIPNAQITSTLRKYDLLAVPSQWLETGPLVVLEAFAACVPVIGSRLGGIAELVRDGVDGILVEPSDLRDWRDKLLRLTQDVSIIDALRVNIRHPRGMSSVATEMIHVYQKLLLQQNTFGQKHQWMR